MQKEDLDEASQVELNMVNTATLMGAVVGSCYELFKPKQDEGFKTMIWALSGCAVLGLLITAFAAPPLHGETRCFSPSPPTLQSRNRASWRIRTLSVIEEVDDAAEDDLDDAVQ